MNQILLMENNGGRGNGPVNTKKIVLIFAIIIIVFGVLVMGIGVYQMLKNKQGQNNTGNNQINNNPVASESSSPAPSTPSSSKPKEDTEEPTLQLSILANKIKVVAEDDVALAYVEYTWNNGEQQIVELDDDATDRRKIETYIDILPGQNTLRVNAVDMEGKSKEKIQEFKGRVLPEISAFITSDGSSVMLKVTCVDGIDNIVWRINNDQGAQVVFSGDNANTTKEQWAQVGIIIEKSSDGKVTSFDYTYALPANATKINVTAYSLKGEVETYEGNIN